MKLQLSVIASAILSISLTMNVAGQARAEAGKPTAAEIKSALTGFTKSRTNSRGVQISHTFLPNGLLKYTNARGGVREGKWWVIGDSPAPTYSNREISSLKGSNPAFCYDFPRAGKGDIRRICDAMEKDGETIYILSPQTGKRAYTLKIKK